MKNMPTYEELLAQNSALKKQVKNLGEQQKKTQSELQDLRLQFKEMSVNYNYLLEQLKLSKKKVFGESSEKIAEEYGQLNLFNEAEAERQPITPEPQIEEITYKRKKTEKRTQDEIYGDLPVEEVIYNIPEEEKICEKCGAAMTFMKYEVRTELKFTPAKLSVVKHKKAVYVCRNCEQKGTESNFKTAEAVPALIEKSLVSPSLLSHIMIQKFCNAMPLYRQEQDFNRLGVYLSRQTMANWMIKGANLLKPLYEKLQQQLVSNRYIHADETTLEVLHEEGRAPTAKSYMWVYRTGRYADRQIVLYKYEVGRSGDFAKKFLQSFSGYLHCDGWPGYDKVENAECCGSWVHLRRYFKNALDELAEIRKEKSADKVNEFFGFCEQHQGITLPKSLTGKAINYALQQKDTLVTFLKDPRIELTNNLAEQAVKPFVIGRKNWLFFNTPNGAQASAIIYSIIETAKANHLNPQETLQHIFEDLQHGIAPLIFN